MSVEFYVKVDGRMYKAVEKTAPEGSCFDFCSVCDLKNACDEDERLSRACDVPERSPCAHKAFVFMEE